MLTGTRIGPYEIGPLLGAGAMGEVYRARDPKLRREVAIKVLPESFASDPDRVRRFEREAQLLAAMSHPHIAVIHGLEHANGRQALILELVEGPTLAERLAAGPLAVDEALRVARQIADALDSAHDKGIVHRDLKPANVKVTADGFVKVLDFGLAKALGAGLEQDASQSPTVAVATRDGVLIGTPVYMSPEQLRGREADRRSDVWAFGCVLYEMLTGRSPFGGGTVSDTISAILSSDPDWRLLPGATPPSVCRLVRRCLEKDRQRRLHDIADARIELDDALENVDSDAATFVPVSAGGSDHRRTFAIVSAVALLLATVVVARTCRGQRAQPPSPMVQFEISLPGPPLSAPRISPDGRTIAVVIGDGTLQGRLLIRHLDSLASRELADADIYRDIFWSPDSRYVAYWHGRRLMRLAAAGGVPELIARTGATNVNGGGAWSADGNILFSASDSVFARTSLSGDAPMPVLQLDSTAGMMSQSLPQFLPDGQHFLYHARATDSSRTGVYVGSTAGERKFLFQNPRAALYAEPGYLIYAEEDRLVIRRFDLHQLAPTGETRPIGFAAGGLPIGQLWISASTTGALVTAPAFDAAALLAWVDRRGEVLRRFPAPGTYHDLNTSRDGSRLVLNQGVHQEIWTMDLERGALTRMTNSPNDAWVASWSPDGRTLAFSVNNDLYTLPSSASGAPKLLLKNNVLTWATDWSADGQFLAVQRRSEKTSWDIMLLDLANPAAMTPLVQSEFNEYQPRFSPDAKWIAYTSDESGRLEVYLQRVGGGEKARVSLSGGSSPRWRADGRELYYMAPDASLMAIPIAWSADVPQIGGGHALFKTNHPTRSFAGSDYVPSNDGQRFLVTMPSGLSRPPSIVVTLNWPRLLEQ